MANAYVSMLDLISRLVHMPIFGLTWLIVGLLLVIVTLLIPNDFRGKGLIAVKIIGYTLSAVFLLPGALSIFLTI